MDMLLTPVRLDSICGALCQRVSRRPPAFHQETNKLRLLGLEVPPTWQTDVIIRVRYSTSTHLTTHDEEGLETTLAGSTVHKSTPEEQPTAS